MVDQRIDELPVLPGVGAVGGLLIGGENVVLGSGDLALGQTISLKSFHLSDKSLESAKNVVLLQGDIGIGALNGLTELSESEATIEVRCVGAGGDVIETLAHHGLHDALDQVSHKADRCRVQRLVTRGALPDHLYRSGSRLRIGDDGDTRLGEFLEQDLLLRLRVDCGRNVGEDRLYLSLDGIHVNVTHDDDRLKIRTVPRLVEIHKALRLECLKVLLAADQGAGGILGVTVEVRKGLLESPPAGVPA